MPLVCLWKSYQRWIAFILRVSAGIAEPGRGKPMRVIDLEEASAYIWFTPSSIGLRNFLEPFIAAQQNEDGRLSLTARE